MYVKHFTTAKAFDNAVQIDNPVSLLAVGGASPPDDGIILATGPKGIMKVTVEEGRVKKVSSANYRDPLAERKRQPVKKKALDQETKKALLYYGGGWAVSIVCCVLPALRDLGVLGLWVMITIWTAVLFGGDGSCGNPDHGGGYDAGDAGGC